MYSSLESISSWAVVFSPRGLVITSIRFSILYISFLNNYLSLISFSFSAIILISFCSYTSERAWDKSFLFEGCSDEIEWLSFFWSSRSALEIKYSTFVTGLYLFLTVCYLRYPYLIPIYLLTIAIGSS